MANCGAALFEKNYFIRCYDRSGDGAMVMLVIVTRRKAEFM